MLQSLYFRHWFLGQSCRSVCIQLPLQHALQVLFNFLLIYFHLLLLFLFNLTIGWGLNISYLKPHPTNLDYISLHQTMSLNLFPCIIAVLDNFPQHSFWIFEQIFLFDVIKRIRIFHLQRFCVFGDLSLMIGPAVAVLMIYPPMTISTSCYLRNQVLAVFHIQYLLIILLNKTILKSHNQIISINISARLCFLRGLEHILQIVIKETVRLLSPCITSDYYLGLVFWNYFQRFLVLFSF